MLCAKKKNPEIVVVMVTSSIAILGSREWCAVSELASNRTCCSHCCILERHQLVKQDVIPEGMGLVTETYRWIQTTTEVELRLKIPDDTRGKDVSVTFQPEHLSIRVGDNTLVNVLSFVCLKSLMVVRES